MDTKKRPTSVTVIGFILAVLGGLGFVTSLVSIMKGSQPLESAGMSIVGLWSLVSNTLVVVSAIAILRGLNWGRLLYMILIPVSIVVPGLLYGFVAAHVGGFIIYIVIILFLTRPAASRFFTSGNSEESKLNQ